MNYGDYDDLLYSIAEDAFNRRLKGGNSLYRIDMIPNMEFIDYNKVIKELDSITRELMQEYEDRFIFDEEF